MISRWWNAEELSVIMKKVQQKCWTFFVFIIFTLQKSALNLLEIVCVLYQCKFEANSFVLLLFFIIFAASTSYNVVLHSNDVV